VDKVKAFVLHASCGAVLGAELESARHVVALTLDEEGKAGGAPVLGYAKTATRIGATFANSELMHASNLFDSYRMLTHPGPVLVAAALANAALEKRDGRDVITALAAGYEFVCRLCDDFIPSTAARGFRPSPIYTTMGAALVTGKLMGLDEDRLVSTIALAANFASGLNEGPRVGSNELMIHEPQAARNAVFAGVMARAGHFAVAETSIEGPAGFYNAFTGSSKGELTYAFRGPMQVDLATITAGLGERYKLLTAMFRMYPCAGYNQPVIDLMVEMKNKHKLEADAIADVAVAMNWIETLYPSPAFPKIADCNAGRIGETQYFAAHAAVNGGVPVVGGRTFGPTGQALDKDERVIAFMKERVRLVPQKDRAMFSPEITVRMKNGATFVEDYPYARMEWTFDQLVARLGDCAPEPGVRRSRFDRLTSVIRGLEGEPDIEGVLSSARFGEA
jgi:hypothetical protein